MLGTTRRVWRSHPHGGRTWELKMGPRSPRTCAGGQNIITWKARFGFVSGEFILVLPYILGQLLISPWIGWKEHSDLHKFNSWFPVQFLLAGFILSFLDMGCWSTHDKRTRSPRWSVGLSMRWWLGGPSDSQLHPFSQLLIPGWGGFLGDPWGYFWTT